MKTISRAIKGGIFLPPDMFLCQQLAKYWACQSDFLHPAWSYDGNGMYLCEFQEGILEAENTAITNGLFYFFLIFHHDSAYFTT